MKKILIAMLLFFVSVYFMLTSYFGDVQINKYTDGKLAEAQQAIEQGWIPALLPGSAYNIAETHNIDNNELFGSFDYKEKDEKALLAQLKTVPDMNNTYRWENFLFKVDKDRNHVKYRNDTATLLGSP